MPTSEPKDPPKSYVPLDDMAALLLAPLAIAAIEVSRGPLRLYVNEPQLFPAVAAHVLLLVIATAAVPLACCVALVLAEAWFARSHVAPAAPRARALIGCAIQLAPAIVLALAAHRSLTASATHAAHWWLVVPFLAFGVGLVALASPGDFLAAVFGARGARLAPTASKLAALAAALGFLTLSAFNHLAYRDDLFTLHIALVQMALPLAFVALRGGLRHVRAAATVRVVVSLALAVFAAAPLLALFGPGIGRVQTRQYTLIGQSQVALRPFNARLEGRTQVPPDPDGVTFFAKTSGYPALPDAFSLESFNLLLISSEAVRWDKTTLADETRHSTPHLRALADDGAFTFANAHSPSSATLPSNASLMAMTYPSATRLETWSRAWCGELLAEETTVAELLSLDGFDTFRITHDFHHGFSKNIRGLGQGFAEEEMFPEETQAEGLSLDQRIAERAVEAIHARKDKRFFGWVYFASPHEPYYVHYADDPRKTAAERYVQEIKKMDEQVGKVIEALKADQLYDKTIIVFLADHGEELGDHGGHGHRTLHNECTHVPFVVRVPGVAGARIATATSTLYLFPWLLARGAGVVRDAAEARMRQDFAPMMRATSGAVITELIGHDKMATGLIFGGEKVIYDFNADAVRAFDLSTDPGEHADLLLSDPRAADELLRYIVGYRDVRRGIHRYRLDPSKTFDHSLRERPAKKKKHKKPRR